MKQINVIALIVMVLATPSSHATEFLFNWQSSFDGGVYDGFIEEPASSNGSVFGSSGLDSFSFGSPAKTYSGANSYLNTDDGVDFEYENGILVPLGGNGFQVLTSDRSQELLIFSQGQAQETVPGQAGVINGTWTVTNLDVDVPDTTNSAMLLATALGALGVFHGLGGRRLAQA